jgi:hypothetical protein
MISLATSEFPKAKYQNNSQERAGVKV